MEAGLANTDLGQGGVGPWEVVVNTLKLFAGGTPEEARNAYRAWWEQQCGMEIVGKPVIEPAGAGWKLSIWHRPKTPR